MTFTHKVNSFYRSQKARVEEVLLHIIYDLVSALLSLTAKALLQMCMDLRQSCPTRPISVGLTVCWILLLAWSYLVLCIHRFQIPELSDLPT